MYSYQRRCIIVPISTRIVAVILSFKPKPRTVSDKTHIYPDTIPRYSTSQRGTFLLRQVRSKGGILEAYLNVNARQEYESAYWTGILDAQGKADGGYY